MATIRTPARLGCVSCGPAGLPRSVEARHVNEPLETWFVVVLEQVVLRLLLGQIY